MQNNPRLPIICIFSILLFSTLLNDLEAQFGFGMTFNSDFYQRYTNPEDQTDLGRSSGNVFSNFSLGPKMWIGRPAFSLSLEAQAGIGIFGFDTKNYKGLGMANFPLLAQLNFKGLSTLNNESKPGFSIGGGVQYNRTELFGVREKYASQGVERSFFPTYIIQAGGGFGLNGFALSGFVRYGFHPDSKASSLNIGMQTDLNIRAFRKNMKNPNSAL